MYLEIKSVSNLKPIDQLKNGKKNDKQINW